MCTQYVGSSFLLQIIEQKELAIDELCFQHCRSVAFHCVPPSQFLDSLRLCNLEACLLSSFLCHTPHHMQKSAQVFTDVFCCTLSWSGDDKILSWPQRCTRTCSCPFGPQDCAVQVRLLWHPRFSNILAHADSARVPGNSVPLLPYGLCHPDQ